MLALVVLLALAGMPEGPCFLPSDQSAGWKRVDLPDEAPALAAPAGLDQFRAGEAVLLVEADSEAYLGAARSRPGRMAYTFQLPRGAAHLEVVFLEPLAGAKVDATAYVGTRAFPLLTGKRQAGASLALDWSMEGVERVVVEVHDHFRPKPIVRHWRLGRWVWPAREASVPEGFRAPRALYFLHPGGRRVTLCEAPGRRLELARWPAGGEPARVALTRVP
jgi:hypothetical protein